jgi:hypothetical protein
MRLLKSSLQSIRWNRILLREQVTDHIFCGGYGTVLLGCERVTKV